VRSTQKDSEQCTKMRHVYTRTRVFSPPTLNENLLTRMDFSFSSGGTPLPGIPILSLTRTSLKH